MRPMKVNGYDVVDTSPAKDWYVLDVQRPHSQVAEVFLVFWSNASGDPQKPHLAASFSTEDDLDKLVKFRDNLNRIIESKARKG